MLSSVTAVLITGGVAAAVTNVGTDQRERLELGLLGLIGGGKPPPNFATSGGWRIQVGTFRSRAGAVARLGETVRNVPELAAAGIRLSPYGALTRAQFVGLPDAASAAAMCAKVVARGTGCYVLQLR